MIKVENGVTHFEGTIETIMTDFVAANITMRHTLKRAGFPEEAINKFMTQTLFSSAINKSEGKILEDERRIVMREENEEEQP